MTRRPAAHEADPIGAAHDFKGGIMNAEVHATTGPFKFQAWCENCKDGYNGSRVLAEDWQQLHNRLKHQEGK